MLGWELPPHYTGGMGLVCYQLCKHLAKTGANIEFILPFTAEFPEVDFMTVNPALPIGVEKVLTNSGGSTYDSQLFTYQSQDGSTRGAHMAEHQQHYTDYVLNLALYGDYDVVHAHDWLTVRAGIAAKQATGLPLIVHIHATEFDRAGGKRGNPLIHEIEYVGLHLADRIIAVSKTTKDTIVREYDIPPERVEVVHNAFEFEPSELEEPRNSYPYLESLRQRGHKIVLGAGRLTIQKGFMNLLYAMKAVIDREPKALLLLVGGGEQYNELISKAAELGIARNVVIVGYLNGTGKAWRDAFKVADLFVMPSVSEPFGLTPFEALTFGSPVLITNQSGASEVLKSALKVDFWDIDEMANMICSVIANDGLAKTLTMDGKNELNRITWEPASKRIMEIYDAHASGVTI